MASNLNKAFMRAYAKDSGRSVPDPAAAGHARPAATTATPTAVPVQPTQPGHSAPQAAARSTMQSSFLNANQAAASHAAQGSIAAPHLPQQSQAPAQVLGGRQGHSMPTHSAPAQRSSTQQHSVQRTGAVAAGDSAAFADAASVWQRIDAAQTIQAPHVTNPPSRPIAAAVGIGSASGPKRMQASAHAVAPPATPTARTGLLQPQQPADLPLLPDEPEAPAADPQAVETRRRTVADFLYSAGRIPGSVARTPVSVTAGPSSVSGSIKVNVAANLGTPTPVLGSQPRSSAAPAERSFAPAAATAVASPLYATGTAHSAGSLRTQAPAYAPAPARVPAAQPEPDALPGAQPAPSIQPPSKRAGQILRVDIPTQARHAAADAKINAVSDYRLVDSAVNPAADSAALRGADATSKFVAAVADTSDQQRRVDREHELSHAEQKLRGATHKIFNPVWEVDSLQWPGVCDKLMEHRAESMAQVAAHLKAACQDGLSILGVTSPTAGEGRTTVACCLARLAATHGLSVVLVDLDLDHPTLCLQTNLEVEYDWRDCLDGEIDLEEVAVHSIDDQLTLLPLKDRADRPELLASDMGIADILRELTESFELVIVDACRMDSAGNVLTGLAAAQVFDAAIVVVDRRNSHQERIEDSVRALQQTGVGSIGIVDNFSM